MATKPNTEFPTTKRDMFSTDTRNVIADSTFNCRYKSPDREELRRSFVERFEAGLHPQMNAAKVKPFKGEDGVTRYQLVSGFGRYETINWFNDVHLNGDPDRRVNLLIAVETDDAAIANIEENMAVSRFSHVDKAKAFARMRDQFDWTQDQIAKRFGVTAASVSQHLKVWDEAAEPDKDAIHSGEKSFSEVYQSLSKRKKATLAKVIAVPPPMTEEEKLNKYIETSFPARAADQSVEEYRAEALKSMNEEDAEALATKPVVQSKDFEAQRLRELRMFLEDFSTADFHASLIAGAILRFLDGDDTMKAEQLYRAFVENARIKAR